MKISNQINNNYSTSFRKVNEKSKQSSERMTTGKRINSAKDDAAGLAIAQKLESLIKGFDKANQNISFSNSALGTADGALSSISDSLQRVRELSITASSDLLQDSDRQMIQDEIDQILDHVNDVANNTQFNGKNLLDGNFKDIGVANNPNGSGLEISIDSATTDSLGLSGFNVTNGKPDLSVIDKALDAINNSRTYIGATSNRLDYTYNSNANTSLNLTKSKSKIEDADMGKESINKNMDKALFQYNMFVKKKQQQNQSNMLNILF